MDPVCHHITEQGTCRDGKDHVSALSGTETRAMKKQLVPGHGNTALSHEF